MTVIHHQHQMSGHDRAGVTLVAACRAQAPAVVHYDTQDIQSPRVLTFTDPSLTGPGLHAPGIFSSFTCSGQRSFVAVSALGAGVMDSSIRHPRCNSLPLLRRGSRLRKQPAKFIFRRISHDLQNLTDAPHYHRQPAPFQACRLSCSPTWQDERTNPWERQPKTGREK